MLVLVLVLFWKADLICDMAQSAMFVARHEHRAIRLSLVFGYQTVAFRQMVMGKDCLFLSGVFHICRGDEWWKVSSFAMWYMNISHVFVQGCCMSMYVNT
jgi:hypothetical protein